MPSLHRRSLEITLTVPLTGPGKDQPDIYNRLNAEDETNVTKVFSVLFLMLPI